MVAPKYYIRLIRSAFFQFPQRFFAPKEPADLSQQAYVVTGGTCQHTVESNVAGLR